MGNSEIILVRNDEALILMRRDDKQGITNPGMVTAFGGKIEVGEEPLDAAYREIQEETNLRPKKEDLLFFRKYIKTKEIHGEDWDVYYFVLRDVDDSELEVYEGKGFVVANNLNEALSLNLSTLFREVVKDFLSNENHL